MELADTRAAARRYLDALAEPFRTAVELRVMREYEYDALAAHLGIVQTGDMGDTVRRHG